MGSVIGFVLLLVVVLVVCVVGALAVQWLGERMGRREPEPPSVRDRMARPESPASGRPASSLAQDGHGGSGTSVRSGPGQPAGQPPDEIDDRAGPRT